MRAFALMVALVLTAAGAAPAGGAAPAEEEGGERGEWVAQVNPHDKVMFVTDCPCEASPGSIELTCQAFGGTAHVILLDFLSKEGKAGDKGEVGFDVDGKASKRSVALEAYRNELVPAFDVPIGVTGDDPWLEAVSAGRTLKLSYGGKNAVSPLKGSQRAIGDMVAYCHSR